MVSISITAIIMMNTDQVFFIIPCVDIYEKIDMRTATYEIPPQEVSILIMIMIMMIMVIMIVTVIIS